MVKRYFQNILYTLPVCAGIGALAAVLTGHSDEKNAVILGFSKFRVLLITAALGFLLFAVLAFFFRKKKQTYLYYFCCFFGIPSAEILLFSRFPSDDTRNLIPLIAERGMPLFLAALSASLFWVIVLRIGQTKAHRFYGTVMLITAVLTYWGISSHIDRYAWQIDLQGNTAMCLCLILSVLLWTAALSGEAERSRKTAAGVLFFLILGYCVTRSTGMWMGRGETPPKAYWDELAEAFLQGRLYLEHPSGTHDLTLYGGKWFVPNPPLPAILLMPFVLLGGSAAGINMCVYSAVIAGINAGLMFLLLVLAFVRKEEPFSGQLPLVDVSSYPGHSLEIAGWVTVLFIFGTDHLWLGTTGQMWFISQLLVVTFTLSACVCVICGCSPVWAGIMLGFGILSRPNIFPVWFCLLGLQLHRQSVFPRIKWKETFFWCLKSGIPVVIAVGLLLLYNKVRFDDWMDFGYVTINGADWILESVQEYGMFHPHFLKINADVMLFGLPDLDFSGERFFFQPHVAGYSIFVMTPALIYVFRSFWKNWFAICAWASVLLSIGLLLLYHNTGAEQIGYRYLLDIAAPLSLLTADGLKGRAGRLFKVLTIFSIYVSFAGIYWWYLGRV